MEMRRNVFLSYAHQDKDFAEKVVHQLYPKGIDVWWDVWEIMPGDSIVDKIFVKGIGESGAFLVVLSAASVQSRWVKEELNVAVIRRLAGLTRIIPLLKEQCAIPTPLQSLHWVDLSGDRFDPGIRTLVKAIYEVSERPPIGQPPDYVTGLSPSIGGLTPLASTIGEAIAREGKDRPDFQCAFAPADIQRMVPGTSPQDISDAVDELEEYGLIETIRYMGTAPFNFGQLNPTYALYLHFQDLQLGYDPSEDVKTIACALAASTSEYVSSGKLQEVTQLPPCRINRAASYLNDTVVIGLLRCLGTAPFSFQSAQVTWKTRQFAAEQCR